MMGEEDFDAAAVLQRLSDLEARMKVVEGGTAETVVHGEESTWQWRAKRLRAIKRRFYGAMTPSGAAEAMELSWKSIQSEEGDLSKGDEADAWRELLQARFKPPTARTIIKYLNPVNDRFRRKG